MAMIAIALAGNPSSESERWLAGLFGPYAELTALGSVHRYYAPAPPPTPVLTLELIGTDGSTRTEWVPDRGVAPRLRYQRQLALAYHLYGDFVRASHGPEGGSPSAWGASYAKHVLAREPALRSVTIRVQQHLVPDLADLRIDHTGSGTIDPDDSRYYTVPELVGEYVR